MNVVLIIPTGIGAKIGGHAGDGNPVAKLIASTCDILITHPNVVNASDINEMPGNTLYVEGSMLDRFLEGEIELQKVHYNKILLAVNRPVNNETINAVSAARATIGADISILELNTKLEMKATIVDGCATGELCGTVELLHQVLHIDFDALAIASKITVSEDIARNYLTTGGINPWGGVEAKLSRLVSKAINKPVAHSPMGNTLKDFNEVVDPRMSPEMVSITYLHCILKGLHRAPRIGKGLSVKKVDFLITPIGCVGEPHYSCLDAGIPIIAVKENKTILNDEMPESFIIVDNYLEAAGLIQAYSAGVSPSSVRRPLKHTEIIKKIMG